MPDKIFSAAGSAAALATLMFFAGESAAQAARCPLGEIYRPSRGICVSKERAVQAGIYRSAPRPLAVSLVTLNDDPSVAEPPVPKPRPQALAAIERRAPASRAAADEALAFVPDQKAAAPLQPRPAASKPVPLAPVAVSRPAPSPFGSLVALEPMP
ncbi:MAG: hypothetical protein JWN07_2966 [Hyphomicrobiales bacterium]|nr:hypothetical protein [Hyphomicrobiales bacterium]